jgi:AcrR family transcriptional regulator
MQADMGQAVTTSHDGPARESARPLRADARRNRDKLVAAARQCFADQGLTVPLDEIARRAGVGAGTMYRHFPTKESLFDAIVLAHVTALSEEARDLQDAAEPGAAFIDFCFRLIDRSAGNRALAEVLARAGTDARAAMTAAAAELDHYLGTLISRAQQAGSIRQDVTMTEVRALLTSIHLAARAAPGDAALPRHLMQVIADGLRTTASGHPAD